MTLPAVAPDTGPFFRLQGLDLSLLGAAGLYLAGGPSPLVGSLPRAMLADEWLGSGTFRNSFYTDPWRLLSHAKDLWLQVQAQGSLRVRVMRASPGQSAEVIREFRIDAAEAVSQHYLIGNLADMLPGSRLFWHIDAVDGAVLHGMSWCTRSMPRPSLRMAVLLRTWGRSEDLRALLQQLADAGNRDPHHADCLDALEFWVLDTSPDAEDRWADAQTSLNLDLRLLSGPNLGGGGNLGHLTALFLQAHERGESRADEVLFLDDDLSLSMESLARHVALCAYRARDVVCSLPVLMKSQPTQVWEDGGFWGRQGFDDPGNSLRQRSLGPHLVRHGLKLDDFAHLDEFGPLNHCEYVTFIFFGLPLRTLLKIGLPAAFFLRGDDVELSLRAGAVGVPVVTNPNLAAWHEPAHSHAQEYMAILHGMMINLSCTDDGAETYASWFEQRLLEHASLGDVEGLKIYRSVLEDLLDETSLLLTPHFETHYPARLSQWQALRLVPLSSGARERLHRDPQVRLLPFLYPGCHPQMARPGLRVLLQDATGQGYWPVPPSSSSERALMMQTFSALLLRLSQEFAALQARWRERLAHSGQPAFWQEVARQHQHGTRLHWRRERHALPQAAPALLPTACALPASVPARELRERLEKELATLSQLRRHVLSPSGERRPEPPASRPSWWKGWWRRRPLGRQQAERRPELAPPLPPDFDPQLYLSLHLDVARTGMDPTRHYLQFGHREGRRYRL